MPPIWAKTGMPAKASGSRSVSGRRVRLVTMICADFALLGMYLRLTSCCASASKRSGTPEADADVALADSAATAAWLLADTIRAPTKNPPNRMLATRDMTASLHRREEGARDSAVGHAGSTGQSRPAIHCSSMPSGFGREKSAGTDCRCRCGQGVPVVPIVGKNQRFENCVPRRAPRRPYFFRSFIRPSRVSIPLCRNCSSSSASKTLSARAIPSRHAPA